MAELADIETAGPSRTRPSNSPTTPANLASGTPGPRAAGSPSPAGPSGYGSGVRRGTDSDTAHWQWLALASAGRAVLLHHAGRDARPSPPAGVLKAGRELFAERGGILSAPSASSDFDAACTVSWPVSASTLNAAVTLSDSCQSTSARKWPPICTALRTQFGGGSHYIFPTTLRTNSFTTFAN